MNSVVALGQTDSIDQDVPIGHIVDDYVDLIDISDPLPDWAATKFEGYIRDYYRLYFQDGKSYLSSDFNGDDRLDIVVYVRQKLDEKAGFLFIFQSGKTLLAAAGTQIDSKSDDFKWADLWEIVPKGITHETTFLDNGDVDGSKEVVLTHSALSIRQTEGSGGLIYFDGKKLIWIHQGD